MMSAIIKEYPKSFPHLSVIMLLVIFVAAGCTSVAAEQSQVQPTSLPQPSLVVDVDNSLVYVVGAHIADTILTGDEIIRPDNLSDTFLKVSIGTDSNTILKQSNIRLLYQDVRFEVFMWGWVLGNDGKPIANEYSFVVPSSADFSKFKLQIKNDAIISLESFFE